VSIGSERNIPALISAQQHQCVTECVQDKLVWIRVVWRNFWRKKNSYLIKGMKPT